MLIWEHLLGEIYGHNFGQLTSKFGPKLRDIDVNKMTMSHNILRVQVILLQSLKNAYQEVEEVKADRDVAESHAVDGLPHHLSGEIGQAEDEVRLGHAHRSHHLKAVEMGRVGRVGALDWKEGNMGESPHLFVDGLSRRRRFARIRRLIGGLSFFGVWIGVGEAVAVFGDLTRQEMLLLAYAGDSFHECSSSQSQLVLCKFIFK